MSNCQKAVSMRRHYLLCYAPIQVYGKRAETSCESTRLCECQRQTWRRVGPRRTTRDVRKIKQASVVVCVCARLSKISFDFAPPRYCRLLCAQPLLGTGNLFSNAKLISADEPYVRNLRYSCCAWLIHSNTLSCSDRGSSTSSSLRKLSSSLISS